MTSLTILLIETYKEVAALVAQKKLNGLIVPKGGLIDIREIKRKITKQAEDEVQKAEMIEMS